MIKKIAANDQSGQVLVLALIVLGVVVINTVLIIGGASLYRQNSQYTAQISQAINLAEAGVDKAVASLNVTGGTYNGETETPLGPGSFQINITNKDGGSKLIESTAYIPSKANPQVTRKIKLEVSHGDGIAFNYALQAGEGGLQMQNNARVNGSVYSNGNITMNNGSRITGDVAVAGGVSPNANQQSDCNTNCQDLTFGRISAVEVDVAQSFVPSTSAVINKVALKLRKIGSPSNLTIRILGDNGNKPNKNNILTSGTLAANLVTDQYSFVEVAFTSTPNLTSGTRYWIVVDSTANNSNYWQWSLDPLNGYTNGSAAWSINWQGISPIWIGISGDLGFKVYMGGVASYIQGANNASVGGNAYANTLNNLTISDGAYYQIANSITAGSTHPNSTDPVAKVMPISDANIQAWKNQAASGGTQTGNISGCPSGTLASKKYVGNLTLSNGCLKTMTSPIWITGNLTLDNGSQLKLDPSVGATSGVLVVDGTISLHNNGKLLGSGTTGSYLMGLTTYDSRTNGVTALDSDNGSSSSILYAGTGIVHLYNNASLVGVTGWRIDLDNGSTVNYQTGLANTFFSSGPSGSYAVIKGSYQIE